MLVPPRKPFDWVQLAIWLGFVLWATLATTLARAANFTGRPDIVAAAEKARIDRAVFWTGTALPDWKNPIPIKVTDSGGGGATAMSNNLPVAMQVSAGNGPGNDLFGDVIPHEVDHAVRWTLLGTRIDRLLDEGAAALAESRASQYQTYHTLRNPHQPLASPFTLLDHGGKDYPTDSDTLLVMYKGGSSLVQWLIEEHGKPRTLELMRQGCDEWKNVLGESPEESQSRYEVWFQKVTRPSVRVLIAKDMYCGPCERLKKDARSHTDRNYDIIFEFAGPGVQVPQATSNGKQIVGYESWESFDKWVRQVNNMDQAEMRPPPTVRPLSPQQRAELLAWQQMQQQKAQQPQQPRVPTPEELKLLEQVQGMGQPKPVPPAPTKEPLPDDVFEGVSVVVAADTSIPKAVSLLEGKGKRMLDSLTKGKVRLLVVSQRTNPDEFERYEEVTGHSVNGLDITILIPQANLGLVKGMAAARIERQIHDAMAHVMPNVRDDIHVEEIFERLHSTDYANVLSVARKADATRDQGGSGLSTTQLLWAILSLVGGKLGFDTGGGVLGIARRFLSSKADQPEEEPAT